MRLAIWSLTRKSSVISLELEEKLNLDSELEVNSYTLKKFQIEKTIMIDDFTKKLEDEFFKYDGHIFIMATGIVVRKIATLIKSKDIDPAVIVIDENKNFAISLLSGHLGGANELTNKIAKICNLVPIITTNSDITGKIAVDTLAQKLNCQLENLEKAKILTSLIVDNKKVELLLPKNIVFQNDGNSSGAIIVSNKKKLETIQLYPKNLILGIGCRRGTTSENIITGINLAMEKNNLAMESIKKIGTVDIKEDEAGLIEACEKLGKKLEIVSRERILEVENLFQGSEFVKKQIGVSSVSQPVAYLISNKKGSFLEEKYIYNGVTISIYEENDYE